MKLTLKHLYIVPYLLICILINMPKAEAACCSCYTTFLTQGPISWGLDVVIPALAKMELKIGGGSEVVYDPVNTNGHRKWMENVVWEGKDPFTGNIQQSIMPVGIKPALEAVGNQLASIAMQQTMIIGQFMDAEIQLDTQMLLQKLQAQANKDYHHSIGVCEFGSNIKSLSASDTKKEINAQALSAIALGRDTGNAGRNIKQSLGEPVNLQQFRTKFCDPSDLNYGLELLCQHNPEDEYKDNEASGGQVAERLNKDIDFTRTIDTPWTLDIDFTDNVLTDNEEEVIAMTSNLYNFEPFPRLSNSDVEISGNNTSITEPIMNYMDMRAVTAKESVARNSFNAITSLKSAGAPGAKEFLIAVMENLLDDTNAGLLLGDYENSDGIKSIEPSYYAQMEVLTKKLVQDPQFYTNLYDKPANVDRKKVALQAIGLMQKFDLFKSHLRNEANLSVLLELEVTKLQRKVENQLNNLKRSGGTTSIIPTSVPTP